MDSIKYCFNRIDDTCTLNMDDIIFEIKVKTQCYVTLHSIFDDVFYKERGRVLRSYRLTHQILYNIYTD